MMQVPFCFVMNLYWIFVLHPCCIRVACVAFWGKIWHRIFKYDGFKSMKKARDINGLLIFQAFPVSSG